MNSENIVWAVCQSKHNSKGELLSDMLPNQGYSHKYGVHVFTNCDNVVGGKGELTLIDKVMKKLCDNMGISLSQTTSSSVKDDFVLFEDMDFDLDFPLLDVNGELLLLRKKNDELERKLNDLSNLFDKTCAKMESRIEILENQTRYFNGHALALMDVPSLLLAHLLQTYFDKDIYAFENALWKIKNTGTCVCSKKCSCDRTHRTRTSTRSCLNTSFQKLVERMAHSSGGSNLSDFIKNYLEPLNHFRIIRDHNAHGTHELETFIYDCKSKTDQISKYIDLLSTDHAFHVQTCILKEVRLLISNKTILEELKVAIEEKKKEFPLYAYDQAIQEQTNRFCQDQRGNLKELIFN